MFDIGFAELLICAIIGLLVLGPERLPGTVRTIGRWVGKARHTVSQFSDQIDRELRADDLRKRIEAEVRKAGVDDVTRQVSDALRTPLVGADHLRNAVENAIAPPAKSAGDKPLAAAAPEDIPTQIPAAPADAQDPDGMTVTTAATEPAPSPVQPAAEDKPQ